MYAAGADPSERNKPLSLKHRSDLCLNLVESHEAASLALQVVEQCS